MIHSWPLNALPIPLPGRIAPVHKQMTLREAGLSEGAGWEDEIHFNTQLSSQWDSLVHWHHQPSGLAYNGISVTKDALAVQNTAANTMPTLDHWHAAGGVVARGVLIDYKEWAEKRARAEGKTGDDAIFSPLDGHRITVEEMEAIAIDQGVEFHPGDILVVRTGLTEIFRAPGPEDFNKLQSGRISGMHGILDSAKWLWNKHFAAVAGDAWAFEALMPIKEDGSPGGPNDLCKCQRIQQLWFCYMPLDGSESKITRLYDSSPPPLAPFDVRNAHRRTMGSQGALRVL